MREKFGTSYNVGAQRPDLVLNIAPIEITAAEVKVGVFSYHGKEQLDDLRARHCLTHFLRREGDEILAVPLLDESPKIGNESRTISLTDNLYLCASLIRDSLISRLHLWNRSTPTYDPIKILADTDSLADLLPGIETPPWLSVRSRYVLTARVIQFGQDDPFVGLVVKMETARRIEADCGELLRQGLPLEGLYVGERIVQDDPRLAPRFLLLGQVHSVLGDELLLTDTRDEDSATALASQVFLDSSPTSFKRCLGHVFGDRLARAEAALEARLAEERSGPCRLERLQKTVEGLAARPLPLLPGATFRIGTFISQAEAPQFPNVRRAESPIYVFDPTGERTSRWNDGGLNEHGPYTRQTFTPNKPRVCVICDKARKGRVEQFLRKFRDGIPASGDRRGYYTKGFVRKYALDDISFEFFQAEGNTVEAYRRAARSAVQQVQRDGPSARWDIAFIQIEDNFHQLLGGSNPYLVTKALFLMQQVPVQAFTIEKAERGDRGLDAILNTMALATYAKLSGIPWLVKADRAIAHEFVVGLGSASIGEGKLGSRERVVGITTVFKGDGNYLLWNLSQAVGMDEYQAALLASLRDTIERVRKDMNWQPKDPVRLIFHAFKPMNADEVEAVKALMGELGAYNVEFAFLHVIEQHPFLLFDRNQPGVLDYETKRQKGLMAPARGGFFHLSDRETLLVLTGPKELKRPSDGMPSPVLLRLHPDSTFTDMTYLARQVYTFSCHSWRNFTPAPLPVTMLYSDLVARLLGQLSRVPSWSPDAMLGQIGTTRWFL